MGYYNEVYVIYMIGDSFYKCFACQTLPAGSIPVGIVNFNTKTIVEITNDFDLAVGSKLFPDKSLDKMNYIEM